MAMKTIILILFFYILVLLQTSFLAHFNIFGIIPNLVLISVIFLNLFTPHYKWEGISAAFFGGFFLDVFSSQPIGWNVFLLVGLAIFIKVILRKYVRIPIR